MKTLKKSVSIVAIVLAIVSLFTSCKQQPEVTPVEAKAITEEAYVYAYPMIMGYRALYMTILEPKSPFFRAPLNELVHDVKPADYTREDVVTMNGDTPYSNFAIDLRAEPIVISVPEVTDRYYVLQFADLFTHNFTFIGTRNTGTSAGDYLFVGPKWKGEIHEGKFSKVFHCETDLAGGIGRTQLLNMNDLPNVLEVQKGYKITPLSTFLGEEPKPSLPATQWLPWKEEALSSLDFINYLNLMLPLVDPINEEDKPALERFAKIGITPGATFDKSAYNDEIIKALTGEKEAG